MYNFYVVFWFWSFSLFVILCWSYLIMINAHIFVLIVSFSWFFFSLMRLHCCVLSSFFTLTVPVLRHLSYPTFCFFCFSRFMNQYFLLIACLQLWPLITPVNPASTWGPLIFIFAVSASKEAWDDYNRYLSDKKANEKEIWVVSKGIKKHVWKFNFSQPCPNIVFDL